MLLPLLFNLNPLPQVVPVGVAPTSAVGQVGLSIDATPGVGSTAAVGTPGLQGAINVPGISPTTQIGTPTLVPVAFVALLNSNYSTSHRGQMAEYRRHGYVNNGWDKLLRWNGFELTIQTAGIVGPSNEIDSWTPAPATAAGFITPGLHVFRYRYLDSTTGFVSNPSEERELIVAAGAEELTFSIGAGPAPSVDIVRSTDPKVDRIVIEMTTVDDAAGAWFLAGEFNQADPTAVVSISDPELEVSFLPWPDTGHDPPPVARNIVSHRDRLWLFGQVVHSTGNCDVTNGSPNVDAGTIDPDWRASALGDDTVATQVDFPSVAWLFQVSGDSTFYEVRTYDAGNNRLILRENFGGVNAVDQAYQLFSRSNVIWVSEPGYPESFSPLKFLNGPNGEGAGDLTAGVGYGSSMLFYSPNSMFKLSWDQGPLVDPVQIPLSNKYGALNQRVVIEVEGTVYSMDRRGWTAWRGINPTLISRPIDAVRGLVNYSQEEDFHAAFYPEIRAIRWFVTYTGETYPRHYVQYDIDTQTWSTGEYYQGITESRTVPSAEGLRVLLGDDQGHLWLADRGTADGVEPEYSRQTIAAGSTGLTVNLEPTGFPLPTALNGVAGAWAQITSTSDEAANPFHKALIVSNTATSITLAGGGIAPVNVGDPIWIGPIPSRLKTKAFSARDLAKKHKNRSLWLEFKPVSQGQVPGPRYLRLRLYQDLSTVAATWASYGGIGPANRERKNINEIVFPGNNSDVPVTDWLIPMTETDGNVRVPLGGEYWRFTEIEFIIYEPDVDLEIISFQLDTDTDLEDEQ